MRVWCDFDTCSITRGKRLPWQRERRDDLDTDRKLNLALVRLLEIVGEAANRTPADERSQYREIPWAQIVGLRNRLIHGYGSVDFVILWQIINHDLPPQIDTLERIVSSQGGTP